MIILIAIAFINVLFFMPLLIRIILDTLVSKKSKFRRKFKAGDIAYLVKGEPWEPTYLVKIIEVGNQQYLYKLIPGETEKTMRFEVFEMIYKKEIQ